jgi:hypothetical protein
VHKMCVSSFGTASVSELHANYADNASSNTGRFSDSVHDCPV